MFNADEAARFASEWIDAWNARDLEALLGHCSDDLILVSPLIALSRHDESGRLEGQERIRAYWEQTIEKLPRQQFEIINILAGVDSLTIYFKSLFGRRVSEVLFLNDSGKVQQIVIHFDLMKERA